jgi:hypothetical protein
VAQEGFSHEFIPIESLKEMISACIKLTALEKLRIILIWAKGLATSYDRTQLQRLVVIYISPTSMDWNEVASISNEFKGTFDIVVPSSLCLTGMNFFYRVVKIPVPMPMKTTNTICKHCEKKGSAGFGQPSRFYYLQEDGHCENCRQKPTPAFSFGQR